MRALTHAEFQVKAEPMLYQVFETIKPLEVTFCAHITGRAIIYPCYDEIESPLIESIISAAANSGDTGCYMYDILFLFPDCKYQHCYVPLSEFLEGYLGPVNSDKLIGYKLDFDPYFREGVIYSATGKWGIRKCLDGFGILGGPQEFLAEIRQKIPDIDRQIYAFLRELKNSSSLSPRSKVFTWLPRLLNHVYGEAVAERILEDIRTDSL